MKESVPLIEPDSEWDALAVGAELSATVLMASGFVLPDGQSVTEQYRVVDRLGSGGMGQVLAVTLVGSTDHQTYALKVVARAEDGGQSDPGDTQAREEAAAQARAFAELLRQEAAKQDVVQRNGVSVARLFALVQLDDGSIGLRMELARGRSLESRIDEEIAHGGSTPPDTEWAVIAVRKLLTQLRRLHEFTETASPFGFIHSDIKPGNVFIDDRDRSDPLVTLLDFGVATAGHALALDIAVRHAGRKSLVLDQTGGTIGYAPPGHFFARPTPLSDVYASLVIMYELITLSSPWDFTNTPKTPVNIRAVEALMKGPARPVRRVRPSIPEREAEVLDAFFGRELKALNEFAPTATEVWDIADAEARRAVVQRLSGLSGDYQSRLDTLLNELHQTDPRAADASSPAKLGAMPTVRADSMRGAQRRGSSARRAASDDEDERELPRRKSGGWVAPLLVLLAVVGGGAAYVYEGLPGTPPAWREWLGFGPVRSPPHHAIPNTSSPRDAGASASPRTDAGLRATPSTPPTRLVDAGSARDSGIANASPPDAGTGTDVSAADAGAHPPLRGAHPPPPPPVRHPPPHHPHPPPHRHHPPRRHH